MKQSLASFIAWRYLRFPEKDHNIRFMIRICFLGIFIGTFSLMLTLIITNGFEKVIHEKMQGINAQIIISANGNKIDYTAVRKALIQKFPTTITAISGNSTKQAIVEQGDEHTVLFMRGIDPDNEHLVSSIAEKIIKPKWTNKASLTKIFPELLQDNDIIIGHKLAATLNCKIGDHITLLIPEPHNKKNIRLSPQKVIVQGFFDVGLEEYDCNMALCSLSYFNDIFQEEGVDQICLKLKDHNESWSSIYKNHTGNMLSLCTKFFNFIIYKIKKILTNSSSDEKIIQSLKTFLSNMTVRRWQDFYPALVSSLKLEKYVMFFILALITLVASMNMIALLFMQIQQKRRDIAILKAMGMPDKKIRTIFLRTGITITFLGSFSGLITAGLAGYWLQNYPFIKLPDVYYISYLPARLDAEIFLIVFIVTMLLGFCATWFPAKQSENLSIARVLREE